MVLDAFVQALSFYGGVPRRVIIDNPKTMVTSFALKGPDIPPRFLALMNHYVMELVVNARRRLGERTVENQVHFVRGRLFVQCPPLIILTR